MISYLKLNKKLGEDARHFEHELIHKLGHVFFRYTALTKTKVQRIVEIFLCVGAKIEADGNSGFGTYTEPT